MSDDGFGDGLNCFTEDEIAAGIPGLLNGPSEAECNRRQKENEEATKKYLAQQAYIEKRLYKRKINVATKLIAGLNDKDQIQNKIIKKLFRDKLDYMIVRYANKEFLSFEYIKIAKQPNCLKILINGFLKQVGKYVLTKEINDEIDSFIETIYINDDLEIVYHRVAKIQKFIHDKIDEKHGKNAHIDLPVKQIRDLLSTARLHLNIQDFMYKDINSIAYLINQSILASEAEIKNPTPVILPKGKKYIKNWRVRHMRPLIYFNPVENKIHEILDLDKNMSTNRFKSLILFIYARKLEGFV
jgi:hypothetical protein